MDLIALVVPLLLVVLTVAAVVIAGKRSPDLAVYALIFLPLILLGLLLWFFTRPQFVQTTQIDPAVLPQLLAGSVGAIIGVVGAGVISIMESRLGNNQRKRDLDWKLRTALKDSLSKYPYNRNACNAPQLSEVGEILSHSEAEARSAESESVIPSPSAYLKYVVDMQAHYK